jgi:hypothetical protein
MVRIIEETLDSAGTLIRSTEMPVIFESRAEAVTFILHYLNDHFADGRSGYNHGDDYWWGCALESSLELRCYRLRAP